MEDGRLGISRAGLRFKVNGDGEERPSHTFMGLLEGVYDPAEEAVGVDSDDPDEDQETKQDSEHDGVFGQSLPLFGAEEFSTEPVDV